MLIDVMMNTAAKGRKYEWKIRKEFESLGYYVIRSAGSKGKVDLIAINPDIKEICLIQCKSYKIFKPEEKRILDSLNELTGSNFTVSAVLV